MIITTILITIPHDLYHHYHYHHHHLPLEDGLCFLLLFLRFVGLLVGMELQRALAICALDLALICILRHTFRG